MQPIKVLFVCGHNTARSQMAEAFLRELGGREFAAESAGLEAGEAINPLAIAVMRELGIEIAGNEMTRAFDLYAAGNLYDYVVTVCSEAQAERCPVFPGITERRHWPLADPAKLEGSWEERLAETRRIRDEIKEKVHALIGEATAD
ncbi:MAG: arsenate reductase ArsC [Synergistales bacterium]|nr:arsenate reductase ArsC [Synergistales bacterium]